MVKENSSILYYYNIGPSKLCNNELQLRLPILRLLSMTVAISRWGRPGLSSATSLGYSNHLGAVPAFQ